jgi:uncharacterized protein
MSFDANDAAADADGTRREILTRDDVADAARSPASEVLGTRFRPEAVR